MLPMSGFGNGGEARQGYGGKGGGGPPGMAQRGGGMMDGRYEDGFPQNVPHGDMRHEAYKMMEFVNHKMQQRQVTLDNMAMQLRYLQKARYAPLNPLHSEPTLKQLLAFSPPQFSKKYSFMGCKLQSSRKLSQRSLSRF